MNLLHFKITTFILYLIYINSAHAIFDNYLNTIGTYLGYKQPEIDDDLNDGYNQKIPYEVSTTDERFISEAAKLTGVALSELDSCQQRVVLKLQTDCHLLNDEQLAKMAVHLLNCQSYVEGRKTYPCNDEMNIRDCTTNMDSDTWTSYHLMSNRARAVCYSIRQTQFRGLAEHTVNRLMEAATHQLKTLGKIANNQENLQDLAENTYNKLSQGQEILTKQQADLRKAQFYGQLAVEDNIKRLIDEKRLISESHKELIQMTEAVQSKLETSSKQLDDQLGESRLNHKELINDLVDIQRKAQEIFKKIDESAHLLIKQNKDFKEQYESTLKNLAEVNKTVNNLVMLVGGTRQALEERLSWLSAALGGTDLAVERLYIIMWHTGFMLVAMLSSAFLSAKLSTRLVVATLPPVNLGVALYGDESYLGPVSLALAILGFILIQTILQAALSFRPKAKEALPWLKEKLSPKKSDSTRTTPTKPTVSSTAYKSTERKNYNYTYSSNNIQSPMNNESDDELGSLTPPISRNGFYSPRSRSRSSTPLKLNGSYKASCHAKTRLGTPCKLTAIPGRDFCHRHQTGDSVMG